MPGSSRAAHRMRVQQRGSGPVAFAFYHALTHGGRLRSAQSIPSHTRPDTTADSAVGPGDAVARARQHADPDVPSHKQCDADFGT